MYCPPGAARGQYDFLWTYVFSGEVDLNENKKGLGMFVGKVQIISHPAISVLLFLIAIYL